jgi:hypothetical protein
MQLRLAQGSLFGTDNQISHTDIKQGSLGDCVFLAGLGAVAHQQPNTIRNMFIDNGDGTFTVRMFGQMNGQVGAVDYVTVDRFLPFNVSFWKNGQYYTNQRYAAYDNGPRGIWVALAEKAYAQFSQSGTTNLPEVAKIPTGENIPNSYQNINGSWGYRGLPSITGTTSVYYADSNIVFGHDPQQAYRAGAFPTLSQISTWLASGKAVTAGSSSSAPNVIRLHEYVVLEVNAVTNTLTLYNPWGTSFSLWRNDVEVGRENNGIRTISYTDFVANFNMVSVA